MPCLTSRISATWAACARKLPITFITFAVATWAIAGLPPFAGFFSKDEILAHAYEHSKILWGVGLLASAMTSFYMFRLLFLTFFGSFRGTQEQEQHLHESPSAMTIPLVVLAIFSAVGGFINVPEALGGGAMLAEFMSPLFDAARGANPQAFAAEAMSHSEEFMLMGISVVVALVAAVVAYVMYLSRNAVPAPESEPRTGLEKVVYHKYYIDELYDAVFVKPMKTLSNLLASFGEFFIDLFVNGAGKLVNGLANLGRKSQTGSVSTYVFAMVVGIMVILFWNLLIN